MENSKFKKVFDFSYVNLTGIREQRRGTLPPEKPEFVEIIDSLYADELPKSYYASKFKSITPAWIVKERLGETIPKYKGKLAFTRFVPDSFEGIRSLKIDSKEKNIVVGYGSGNIEVWPVMENEDPITIKPAQKGFPITSLCFILDSTKFFAASLSGALYLCLMDPLKCTEFIKEDNNEINTIDVDQRNPKIVTGGKDAAIRIYDIETCKKTNEFKRNNSLSSFSNEDNRYHALRIFAVKFHPNYPEIFISGGCDGYAKIWDTRVSSGCVRNLGGPYISGEAIEANETEIITGSFQMKNSLQLWDVSSGKLIENILLRNRSSVVNGEFINTLKYLASDPLKNTVVAGGLSSNVEVIDVNQKETVFRFPVTKTVLAIDNSEKYLAFGGHEHFLHVIKYNK
ncbi:hypothetical protein RN001_012050 [Aquatica leii]|uniref:Uncharacterized protein n=1 Tax=Aquatica leii TaxID=1421715 RepID=A0AAN7QEH3_9COLE|nr:hypothetical protein RN001_012050 [Aquatica leii]